MGKHRKWADGVGNIAPEMLHVSVGYVSGVWATWASKCMSGGTIET
jgi:hypothetical protein